MFMPPPQHLLSPKERLLLITHHHHPPRRRQRQPNRHPHPPSILPTVRYNFSILLHLVVLLLLHLIPSSAPSSSQHSAASSWVNSVKGVVHPPHWSIPEEEICPSAAAWVVQPGSFCTTLWASPYLSNRTELEARERRAVQLYCELDAILERFDCGQEYSVNVQRGQCQLCRQAYREWSCAVVADTQTSGSLDCDSKLMPCPSCASICHQVMRLCPYLSPDRMQYDLGGKSLPQVSQYGGHPAFYCPLENDDPSDPAYTSLCYKPFVEEDPDHVHNICTNPPKTLNPNLQQNPSNLKSSSSITFSKSRSSRRSSRNVAYYDGYTSPSSSSSYDEDNDDDDSVTGWSSEFPLHYTTCCWTYASSLVIFDPKKDYPNYGSDAFFSTTLNTEWGAGSGQEWGPLTREKHREKKLLEKLFPGNSSTIAPTKAKSSNASQTGRSSTKVSSTSTSTSKSKNASTTTTTIRPETSTTNRPSSPSPILPGDEANRVILNCCNSQGDCNAVDGEEPVLEKVGESSSSGGESENPVQEIKSDPSNKLIKNRKRSSERLGNQDRRDHVQEDDLQEEDEEEEEEEGKLDGGSGSLDQSSKDSASSSSSSSSATVLSLPSLFFKTIDSLPVANPTHISELEDLEYDEHYLDTEPDGGESSASSREDGDGEDADGESEEDEEKVQVQQLVNASTPPTSSSTSESSAGESVHYLKLPPHKEQKKAGKDAFMSIVIQDSDSRQGVDHHVLDRDHHPDAGGAAASAGAVTVIRTRSGGGESERTKQNPNDVVDLVEEQEDESFTFVDNTNTLFSFQPFGGGDEVRQSDAKTGTEFEKHQEQKQQQQQHYYYARHNVPSSSSSKLQSSSSLYLYLFLLFIPKIGLSLEQLQLLLQLSPTNLISCVFIPRRTGRRRMCLNSFVMVVLVGLPSLLFLLGTTFTTTSTYSALTAVVGVAVCGGICWSFLRKNNFRTRTRTSKSRSSNRYKKSCVHSSNDKEEKVTEEEDDGRERNFLIPNLPPIFFTLSSAHLHWDMVKLFQASCYWCTRVVVIVHRNGDDDGLLGYNYYNIIINTSKRRTRSYTVYNNPKYNYSAWVQSSLIVVNIITAKSKSNNRIRLIAIRSTTQIQDFYRHYYCNYDHCQRLVGQLGAGKTPTSTTTTHKCTCYYHTESKRRRKDDDNNPSCTSYSSNCRRKRRKQPFICTSRKVKVISSRKRFKEISILRDFLLELQESLPLSLLLLQQRLIGEREVVVFNFKQFLKFILSIAANVVNDDLDLDAPSKSLKQSLKLCLNASMLALLLEGLKFKLKLLRVSKNMLVMDRISSNYYSTKIISTRKKKWKEEDICIYIIYSSPSNTRNEATIRCKILQKSGSCSCCKKRSGHPNSSQCCRTENYLKLLRLQIELVKIEIIQFFSNLSIIQPSRTSITIIMIKSIIDDIYNFNSYNGSQFHEIVVRRKTQRIKFCPMSFFRNFSRRRKKLEKYRSTDLNLASASSRRNQVAIDLHLLSLLLSLAKRAARKGGRKLATLQLFHLHLLLLLRGQSKTLIELFDRTTRHGGGHNSKSFKVYYARGTLKLLRFRKDDEKSTIADKIRKIVSKSIKWWCKIGKKSEWCSSSSQQKKPAGSEFEIHPLIKL